MKILVTGANGFLGSHISEAAMDSGHEVVAGIRPGANLRNIAHLKVTVLPLTYSDRAMLTEQLTAFRDTTGAADLIIHNAGLTKSASREKNFNINAGLTANLLEALKSSGLLSETGKFVYISSMAALGPVSKGGPVSTYGESKLAAESEVKKSGIPYVIFRPTAIYGPRDHAFLPLFKTAKFGLYPHITPETQKVTMVLGRDAADNIVRSSMQAANQTIHLDDGQVYSHHDLRHVLGRVMNKKLAGLTIPRGITFTSISIMEKACNLLGIKPPMTLEKFREISGDWNHDFSEERKGLPLLPCTPLEEGFKKTYAYYQQENLI